MSFCRPLHIIQGGQDKVTVRIFLGSLLATTLELIIRMALVTRMSGTAHHAPPNGIPTHNTDPGGAQTIIVGVAAPTLRMTPRVTQEAAYSVVSPARSSIGLFGPRKRTLQPVYYCAPQYNVW